MVLCISEAPLCHKTHAPPAPSLKFPGVSQPRTVYPTWWPDEGRKAGFSDAVISPAGGSSSEESHLALFKKFHLHTSFAIE